MTDASLIVALATSFVAGIVSFLAPCVLPIIPGFLAYLAGTPVADASKHRRQVFVHSLLFVIGFSLVFALLGVLLNTILERVAYDVQTWLSRIGGAIIIFFGLYLTGLFHIAFLERKHGFTIKQGSRSRYLTSVLFGASFAAGWTPCVGVALGAILGLAATQPGKAFYLLLSYAIGLGIPFLIVGLFAAKAQAFFLKYRKATVILNRIFGVILIILGILIFTQQLARIANFEVLNMILLN
ncbi:MAG: cytochrome C biogenesis protein [Candidatus Komeilibacteria bacterium]|nr:cytochrome C biogenesis protein [Candidatus Komeilibacteria bacterium]